MLTIPALEKRLRELLEFSTCQRKKLKDAFASIEAQGTGTYLITMPLPKLDDDFELRLLLHELVHASAVAELSPWHPDIQEDILQRVLEPQLIEHIFKARTRHNRWLKLMKRVIPDA